MAFAVETVALQLCPAEGHSSGSDVDDDAPSRSGSRSLSRPRLVAQNSLQIVSDGGKPVGEEVCAGFREFLDYMKTQHSYDPYLGLRPDDLTSLWDAQKVFRAVGTTVRACLNLYESLKMVIELETLWLGHYSEETDIGFLQRNRIWWVTGVFVLEFSVLWTCFIIYLPYAIGYIGGCLKPRAELLIGSPLFIANFSVLQFAMYVGPDDFLRQALWVRVKQGTAYWWWRYKHEAEDLDEIPFYTSRPHTIEWVIWLLMWTMFIFLGIVAFLTKMSFEVGSILFHDIATWGWSDWTGFFAFVNNCVNIVDIDSLGRHRLMTFRFSGHDATWTPREVALMQKYDRMIATMLNCYLGSRMKSAVALASIKSEELQRLLISDSTDRLILNSGNPSKYPLPWMMEDVEHEISGGIACLQRCLYTVKEMSVEEDGWGAYIKSWLGKCVKVTTTQDERQEHFEEHFTPDGDFTALVNEMRTCGSLDPNLGFERRSLLSLWHRWRCWVFFLTALRCMLNIFEASSMLFIDVWDLWLRDMSGNEAQQFLQRHRRYWITGVAILEFSVIFGTLACVVVHYLLYLSFRTCGNASVLLNYLRRVADFSVLQFAMYMNSHILETEAAYWISCIDMQAWLVATCGGSRPLGDRKQLALKTMGYLVVYGGIAAFVLGFGVAGLIAFLTKMSFEVGGILFKSMNEWTWSEWFRFIGFINNAVGIVETDRLMRDRILIFAFEGRNAYWTARGVAMRQKYERVLVRLTEEYLGSRRRALVLLGTFTHRDLQTLLVSADASGKDEAIAPKPWMYSDFESSGTEEDSDSDSNSLT